MQGCKDGTIFDQAAIWAFGRMIYPKFVSHTDVG